MAERIFGPKGRRRRRRLLFVLPVLVALGLATAIIGYATGPVGTLSNFEDDDGDLALTGSSPFIDWNSFSVDLADYDDGTAPYRIAQKTFTSGDTAGWKFTGVEDAQATTSDTAFGGGTKQDDECPKVGTQKADNKADLKRVYFASKTIPVTVGSVTTDHVILNLAWVRIPQNTTSPSAHVAFEFNQNEIDGTNACGGNSGDLVERSTANGGDVLILYDFEGGTDTPTIRLSRWLGTEWSVPVTLTSGQAEAKVNTTGSVTDAIGPFNGTQSLGTKEFGEAGIDLTAAGVFTGTDCLVFGTAYGATRTSGNSNDAQMKDLAGPVDIDLANCANPGSTSAPTVVPQDSVTVSGLATGGSTSGTKDKKLLVTLWDGGADTAGCDGTLLYEKDFGAITANGTFTTDNDGVDDPAITGADGYTIAADKKVFWKVVYNGDSKNNAFTECNESADVDLTADTTP